MRSVFLPLLFVLGGLSVTTLATARDTPRALCDTDPCRSEVVAAPCETNPCRAPAVAYSHSFDHGSQRGDAAGWSPWRSFDNENLSVSVSQINHETWTWKFRNDGYATITYLEFEYVDRDGTHSDVLPVNLKPNEVFGGWAAFTASSSPGFRLLKIKRQ